METNVPLRIEQDSRVNLEHTFTHKGILYSAKKEIATVRCDGRFDLLYTSYRIERFEAMKNLT